MQLYIFETAIKVSKTVCNLSASVPRIELKRCYINEQARRGEKPGNFSVFISDFRTCFL